VRAAVQLLVQAWSKKSREPRLSAALGQLASKSLPAIAASLGITERHMRRLFMQEVGIGPSRFKSICRLQPTIDAMRRTLPADVSMATFALDHGFSDQAHMNHDVKDLTGLTPKALLQSLAHP